MVAATAARSVNVRRSRFIGVEQIIAIVNIALFRFPAMRAEVYRTRMMKNIWIICNIEICFYIFVISK